VSVIVDRRNDVLRIPAAALRFRPEGFDATARPARTAAPEGSGSPSAGPAAGGAGAAPNGGRRRRAGADGASPAAADASAPSGARAGGGNRPTVAFVLDEKAEPQPVRIRPGLSDGQFVEVVDGLTEGQQVVTGVASATARGATPRAGASPAANPFAPAAPQRRTR
jgi:HlyD family secretion protein